MPSVQRGLRRAGIYVNYERLMRVLHISERLGLITIASISIRKTDGTGEEGSKKGRIKFKFSGRLPQILLLATDKGKDFFERFHTLEDAFKNVNLEDVYRMVYSVWSRMQPSFQTQ